MCIRDSPVFATDLPSVREATEGNAFLAKPGKLSQLVSKIINNQQNDGEISPEVNRNQSENDRTIDEEKSSYGGEDPKQTRTEEIEKEENSQSTALAREEEQALEQWLRRVPDDPGGLLRNKFKLQFEERIRKGEESGHDGTNDW